MDVVTQLEQACAHGCVLLSETFAVALRPADPAFSGDGVPRQSSDVAAAGPSESGEDIFSGVIVKDPLLSAVPMFTASSSSLMLSLSTAATSLPHDARAPSVTVRRLGLQRVPTAVLPRTTPGACAGSGIQAAASDATGDAAFDLLPASDLDLVGACALRALCIMRGCHRVR